MEGESVTKAEQTVDIFWLATVTCVEEAGESRRDDTLSEPQRFILSYGGGINTVALMILLVENSEPLDEVVFADTGGEVPETYEYIEITREYLERHDIPFRTVQTRKHGKDDLYANCWNRQVIPSALWRWSTRDFKVQPIHRYYRSLGVHINQYMGIAFDEVERMKDSRVPFVTNLYPLIDHKMTRDDCVELIKNAGFPVPVKSGCYFCPFNSLARWRWLHSAHPELYSQAVSLEENSKHFPDQRLTDQVFRDRATVTLRELAERFDDIVQLEEAPIANPCGGECMT